MAGVIQKLTSEKADLEQSNREIKKKSKKVTLRETASFEVEEKEPII
jgi:hypothetical protein